jgi:pullulanase/glycogen debranching enzyme
MYEQFGAVVHGSRVTFKLFVPDNQVDPTQYVRGGSPRIKHVHVRGDFQSQLGDQDWELERAPVMLKSAHPNGWLYSCSIERELTAGFYQYKYFITFENETTRWCSDPCTKYGGGEEENSGFVVGGNSVKVQPIARRLAPKDLVMYELMIDDFTSELRGGRAPVDVITDKLDYLQRLGINAIEFMPWTAWAGSEFSWGYDPVQFFSVEHRYVHDPAAPADRLFRLKTLINELHRRHIHVVMDGVFNHVRAGSDPNHGFGYHWLYEDPADSPFIGRFGGGGFFEEFDFNNGCVRELIRDVCIYWLDQYQLDGIRFDFTLGFDDKTDKSVGITRLISDLRAHLAKSERTNVALMLEHLTDDRFQAIDDTNRICADACWFDPLMFKASSYALNGTIDAEILRHLNTGLDFQTGKGPVTYIQNHDHSSLVSQSGGRERWFKTQPAAIALLTSPGAVLIHNGQEFGEDYFIPQHGENGRVAPRPLRWAEHGAESGDFIGGRLFALYRRLIAIRTQHPALRSNNFFPYPSNHPDGYGAWPNRGVVIYHRYGFDSDGKVERFIIAINYTDVDQWIDLPFSSNGIWEDLLNDLSAVVSGFRLSQQRIHSNWGRIYFQKAQD